MTIPIDEAPQEIRELMTKFRAALQANRDKTYAYQISAAEVSVLHGLIRLAHAHPEVEKLSQHTQDAIYCFREFCKMVWQDMGLTEEEAEAVDQLREKW